MSQFMRNSAAFLLGLTLSVCGILLAQDMLRIGEPPRADVSEPPVALGLRR